MIQIRDNVFYLGTGCWSCLLRITGHGLPELVHFGAPVDPEDAAALTVDPGLGWGASLQLDEDDPASCPDALPLFWSGSGRGDLRESPVELSLGGAPMPGEFRLAGYRVVSGSADAEGLPQAHGADETLELTFQQLGSALLLRQYFTVFPQALVRRTRLENPGQVPVTIHKLMSWCMDLPGRWEMTTLDGGWIAEAHRHRTPVGPARVVNESVTGFSSHRHNTGFLLSRPGADETHGDVIGLNLLWSGNHYASAQRSHQGLTRVMQGVSPADFLRGLAPGAAFDTPEGVLCWSGEGFGGLSARMHRFVTDHIVPPYWRERPRPVLYNDWEGCMFSFTQRKLLDLARRAKKLGCELFVLDDGWFGARDSDRAGLGDYSVNRRKLPEGLAGLSKKIRAMGLAFGLWFEPESVNPDSDLYRAHPDWALTEGQPPLLGRHQLLLDLRKAEVRDYIVEHVSAILDSAEISYVKWDMNRHSTALGSAAYDYVLGLYDVLRRIFGPRPQILLESCSSGGNRFDLGMLTFSPQIWASDDTDPIERLAIQEGLSYLYPQSTVGAHVSAAPHAQTLRQTPLSTRGNVSFFGVLGYELDLAQLLPVEEAEIARQIAFYKEHRETFQFGTLRRLEPEEGVAVQVTGANEVLAGVFHRLVSAAPGYEWLRLRDLDPETRYRVTSRAQSVRIGPFGGLLRHVFPVELNPSGVVLRTADRHYALPDGGLDQTASGRALMAGLPLPPRFTGTGYDKALRVQGDFGSNLYLIREVDPNEIAGTQE